MMRVTLHFNHSRPLGSNSLQTFSIWCKYLDQWPRYTRTQELIIVTMTTHFCCPVCAPAYQISEK